MPDINKQKLILGRMIEFELLDRKVGQKALEEITSGTLSLRGYLVGQGILHQIAYATFASMEFNIPMVDMNSKYIDPDAVSSLPREFAYKHRVFPVNFRGQDTLVFAAEDLIEGPAVEELRAASGKEPRICLSQQPLDAFISRYYTQQRTLQ